MKTNFLFSVLLMSAAILASCDRSGTEPQLSDKSTLIVTIDDFCSATRTELFDNSSSKHVSTKWSAGDKIKVFSVHGSTVEWALFLYESQDEDGKARFVLDSESENFSLSEFAAAYYPGENATAYDKDTKTITATIPATQTYAANSFGKGAAPMTSNIKNTSGKTPELHFKNAFTVLKLNLIGSKKISQIRVSAPSLSTATALSGTFNFTLTDDNGSSTITKTDANDAGYEVTLNCSAMIDPLTSTATPFHVVLPPMPENTRISVDVIGDNGIVKSFTTVTGGSGNSLVQNNIVNMPNLQPSIGLFSVSDNKQVRFSPGNMYYTSSTGTYSFEAHQYDYRIKSEQNDLAVINGTSCTTPTGTVGSFFWSNTASVAYAIRYSDGSAATTDVFFTNATATTPNPAFTCDGATGVWRTLSGGADGEWKFLMEQRTDANKKYGSATVAGIKGIIILPDVFTDPMKNNGSNAFVPISNKTGWDANVYTTGGNWEAMEAAGAVFLPAAGYFSSTYQNAYNQITGPYWSSNCSGTDKGFYLNSAESGCSPGALDRHNSVPVRLVKDAITEYSTTQDYINGDTITLE